MAEMFEYKTTSLGTVDAKTGAIDIDKAQGIVECFVAGIGNKDSVGDIVATGAFTKSLQRRKPRVVWGHNWNDPIGKVIEIYEVPPTDPRLPMKMKMAGIGGLFARVQFNLQSEKGREAFANVAFFGEEQEWSIGYKTLRAQYDQKSQANVIYELELYEVSPVLHGANQLTGTISVKADMQGTSAVMEMEMPSEEPELDRAEMEKQLSQMLGTKVSVLDVEDETITYARREADGKVGRYKCHFGNNNGRFMFGVPQRIVVVAPAQPAPQPRAPIGMPSPGMPSAPVGPVVMRPTQMPSMPVAIKPGPDGISVVPLPPVQYGDEQSGSRSPDYDANNLDKEEADLRDALLKIVKRHGRFNEDGNGVFAGYKPASQNPVSGIGVKCANCVFYQGGSSCKIIDMEVEPEGKCRFAVIPNGVVKGDSMVKKSAEIAQEIDEDEFLAEMEFKYPGELAIAALRGIVGRKRKKRRKYKNLAEFGLPDDELEEKAYYIPVAPEFAFTVKQALDPIFDYHYADTFVDTEGIVISSGVSYELIDAVDTALSNLKKKILDENGLEEKALGYRLGRAIGSRLMDRPNIGGRRGGVPGRGLGMPSGDLNPRTRRDSNLNGIIFDNIPGWEQPDPTPNDPGSINNPDPSPKQIADEARSTAEAVEPGGKFRQPVYRPKPGEKLEDQIQQPVYRPKPGEKPGDNIRLLDSGEQISDAYKTYLATPPRKRSKEDVFKFDGPFGDFPKRLASGILTDKEADDRLKQGYKDMAEQIIKMMEEAAKNPGGKNWKMPWRQLMLGHRNPTTKNRAYEGMNIFYLSMAKNSRGYPTNKWAGAAQWKKLGGRISKDEQPVVILAPDKYPTPQYNEAGQIIGMTRGFHPTEVYNVAQVKGLKPEMYLDDTVDNGLPESERLQMLEDVIKEIGPKWFERGQSAHYMPRQDIIEMPPFAQFDSSTGFYGTLLHEITHWTGHSSRLDRKAVKDLVETGQIDDATRGFEELIAEIGSVFAMGFLGLEPEVREDHIPYLAGWISHLKSDPTALERAIQMAQQAVDYMMNKSATLRKAAGKPDSERKGKDDFIIDAPIVGRINLPDKWWEKLSEVAKSGKIPGTNVVRKMDHINEPEQTPKPAKRARGKNRDVADTVKRMSSGKLVELLSYTADTDEWRHVPFNAPTHNEDGMPVDTIGRLASGGKQGKIKHLGGDAERDIERIPADVSLKHLFGLKFELTAEQREVPEILLDLIHGDKPKSVISIVAGAGTGKTTTLQGATRVLEGVFDVKNLMGDAERPFLKKKMKFLKDRFGLTVDAKLPNAPEGTDERLAQEKAFQESIISAAKQLGLKVNPSGYYIVFNTTAAADAQAAFRGDSTGVSTLAKMAFWSLVIKGDEKYGDGFSQKLLKSIETVPRGYQRNADGTPKIYTWTNVKTGEVQRKDGRPPSVQEQGYGEISDEGVIEEILGLSDRYGLAGSTASQRRDITNRVVQAPAPFKAKIKVVGPRGGVSTQTGDATDLTVWEYERVLLKAIERFSNSSDMELSAKHFIPTGIGREHEYAEALGDDIKPPADIDWKDEKLIPPTYVADAKALWDKIIDPQGWVLPSQNHTEKLWGLTNPDLRSDAGLLGQTENKDLFEINLPNTYQIGDKITGDVIGKNPEHTYVVTKVRGAAGGDERGNVSRTSKMRVSRLYGSEESPIDMFMIDESQDMNPVMTKIINENRDNVNIVMVGDPRQGVYEFRGAENIMGLVPADYMPRITESRRFGTVIGHLANLILARANLEDDRREKPDSVFSYVRGQAHEVVAQDFNLEAIQLMAKAEDASDAEIQSLMFQHMAMLDMKYHGRQVQRLIDDAISDVDLYRYDPDTEQRVLRGTIDQVKAELKELQQKYGKYLKSAGGKGQKTIDLSKLTNKQIEDWEKPTADYPETLRAVIAGRIGFGIEQEQESQTLRSLYERIYTPEATDSANREDRENAFVNRFNFVKQSELRAARGELTTDTHRRWDARLMSTNRGVLTGAFEAIQQAVPRYDKNGIPIPTVIAIPASKFEGMKQYFKYIAALDAKYNKGKNNIQLPAVSNWIGSVSSWGEVESRARSGTANAQHATFFNMQRGGIEDEFGRTIIEPNMPWWWWDMLVQESPMDPKAARDRIDGYNARLRELINEGRAQDGEPPISDDDFAEQYKIPYLPGQIIPARKRLHLDAQIPETGESLRERLAGKAGGRAGMEGREIQRDKPQEIIPAPKAGGGKSKATLQQISWVPELDEKGNPTGAIDIYGDGLQSIRDDRTDLPIVREKKPDGSFGRKSLKNENMGLYRRDLEQILQRYNYFGGRAKFTTFIRPKKNSKDPETGVPEVGGYHDGVRIKGATEEDTAEILNIIRAELRHAATEVNADQEVTTIQLSKGGEWDSVIIGSDFKLKAQPEQRTGSPWWDDQKGEWRRDSDGTILDAREFGQSLNLGYVAVTRARRVLNPGTALGRDYFGSEQTERERAAQKAAAAAGRFPEDLLQENLPEGYLNPYDNQEDFPPPLRPVIDPNNPNDGGQSRKDMQSLIPNEVESSLTGEDVDSDEDSDAGVGEVGEQIQSTEMDEFDRVQEERDAVDEQDIADAENAEIAEQEPDRLSSGVVATQGQRRASRRASRRLASGGQQETGGPRQRYMSARSGPIERVVRNESRRGREVPGMREMARAGIDFDRLIPENATDAQRRRLISELIDETLPLWTEFRRSGIALDIGPDTPSPENSPRRRLDRVREGIRAVGKVMQGRNIQIGNVRTNSNEENWTADKWMLPVEKLMSKIKIPVSYTVREIRTPKRMEYEVEQALEGLGPNARTGVPNIGDRSIDEEFDITRRIDVVESRNMTIDELAELLGIPPSEKRKLSEPGAGISHSSFQYLVAALGSTKSPRKYDKNDVETPPELYFPQWKLLAPVTKQDLTEIGANNLDAIAMAVGRGQMRDRMLIETFGKDAYPIWYDRDAPSPEFLTPDEYENLDAVDSRARFMAQGRFDRDDQYKGMESEAEYELLYGEGLDGNDVADEVGKEVRIDKTQRADFRIEPLLAHFGIEKDSKFQWREKLRDKLIPTFGTQTPKFDKNEEWSRNGVPTAWVAEMIKRGVIFDAQDVWKEGEVGKKFDDELKAQKHVVFEALYGFASRTFPDSRLLTPENMRSILGDAGWMKSIRNAVQAGGSPFTPKKGDEPRYTRNQLQDIVDRFNEIFGTSHTIDDIFSDEQLRQARRMIEEEKRTSLPSTFKPQKNTESEQNPETEG